MIQKYSFKDFLTKEVELINNGKVQSTTKINKIEIPMIQRDYAQGRKLFSTTKEEQNQLNPTGEKFINELFDFLIKKTHETQMELDFVYGSIKLIENTVYFYPLDGQQRLTTLFLLYWFIGGTELNHENRCKLANILCNFYYQTRTSSNIFCKRIVDELCKDNINFLSNSKTNDPETESKQDLISQIQNLSWFHDSFKLDPTVQAMMNMLAKIQELYIKNNCQNLFTNLENLRFYVLPLSNFELTEDLYVKMNARGKQLTGFENFKADFQHWIKTNAQKLGFTDQIYDNRVLPYDMFFINKIDNEWSRCFWKVQKDSTDKNFDPLLLSFFYKYWLNDYILNTKTTNKKLDKELDFILLRDEPEYLGFSLFERNISKASTINLQILLDKISEHYDEISEIIQPAWATNESSGFCLLKGDYGFKERVAFSAVVLYLTKKEYDPTAFKKWMRVAWNIIENANIDSVRVMAGVIQLIDELSDYSEDIYSMLANDTIKIESSQSSVTIKEERLKSKLILSNPEWNSLLIEAESHPYFKGSVSFLISDDEDIEKFKHAYQMAQIFFSNDGVSEKYRGNSHIFLRALISRYSSLSEIKYHITDKSEKENALKNMLASDKVVQTAIKEWFSLDSEEKIAKKLFEEVKKESPIAIIDNDFEKKLHESLYKETDLINWMQEKNAIRYKDNYISKPNSWYDWIYVYGYRNEIILELMQDGWKCENQCYIGENENKKAIPYFWSGDQDIGLKKNINYNNEDILLKCYIGRYEISIHAENKQSLNENYIEKIKTAKQLPSFIKKLNSRINTYICGDR